MLLPERDLEIETIFPKLAAGDGYRITSPKTTDYNCIAWAGCIDHLWWWPDESWMYFWPSAVQREATIPAFIAAYTTLGFAQCDDDQYEEGFEKIAIFTDSLGAPTHAARQLNTKFWTSKLGGLFDISHMLDGVSGISYGTPTVFMKRVKPET